MSRFPVTSPQLVGVRLERWTVEAKLGEGGMGTVWRARDDAGQIAAIKLLRHELCNTEDLFARFLQEAQAASRLGNPHIAQILGYGQTPSGQPYTVMEYCDGPDLLALLEREGPLSWRRAFALGEQICGALHDAHAHGIIHRDVKPENFILLQGEDGADLIKVLDFGIAKLTDPDLAIVETRTGVSLGTPEYMAPEQGEGLDFDARIDIYGVGVLLYQLVTGRVPFEGKDEFELMQRHMSEAPEPPSERAPQRRIPTIADAVILQALEKDREHRYCDMQRFALSLKSARTRADSDLSPTKSAAGSTGGSSSPLGWALLGALIIFAVALGIGLTLFLTGVVGGP